MSKQVLWGGPEDGKEVIVEVGQNVVLTNLPTAPDTFDTIVTGDVLDRKNVGRYQYNSMSKRFEWMGYE